MSDPEAPAGDNPDLTPLIEPPVEPVLPAPVVATVPVTPASSTPPSRAFDRPTFVFFGVVSAVSLILDVLSKAWAEIVLSRRPFDNPSVVLVKDHLTLTIAYNKGGAWGLLQDAAETVRRPFFFAVSVLAVLFIVSLYSKLGRGQRALMWGLPLVLGGALGNLSDRITRSSVIDFIDYRAEWVLSMNTMVAKAVPRWGLTDHWPTFNVADIAICIGVGLMAVDMFTARRGPERRPEPVGPVLGA
ncbi:MAG TPA: signal peptidase II [Polyangiaceae bacterium]|nr:signal peptidase II [Polyangiaceae bacterium]